MEEVVWEMKLLMLGKGTGDRLIKINLQKIKYKHCYGCSQTYLATKENFGPRLRNKSGLTPRCRNCSNREHLDYMKKKRLGIDTTKGVSKQKLLLLEVSKLLKETKLSQEEIGKKFSVSGMVVFKIKQQLGLTRSDIRANPLRQCKTCNKPFRWKGKKGGSFCSKVCYTKWQKTEENMGEKNPNWKDNAKHATFLKQLSRSDEWKTWRKTVYERDNYTCELCQNRGGKLHPHHILRKVLFPEKIFDINNGITLCRKCHVSKVNGREVKYQNLFTEIVTGRMNPLMLSVVISDS